MTSRTPEIRDVLIIGSGAGGAPLALVLAGAGLDVLVLEKGPRHSRDDYAHDGGIPPGAFIPTLDEDPHTVVTPKTTAPLLTNLGWIATCVGGGTVHMGGYFYRFHPDDFRMLSRFGPYEELADWPYGYDELEPYYARAEWEIGVAGEAGSNPFEARRSRPYPLPPLEAHPLAADLEEACRRRGYHPFPTPRSINSRPYQGRPACAYCQVCATDPEVRDRWGLPVARVHLDLPGHHHRAGAWVMERAFEILGDLGGRGPTPTDVGGTSRYLVHGTCRAGTDPETSVLNAFCQAHEVENLFVVDGSFMPTSGGAAPTLTIVANSFRTADHVLARIKAGDFG